MSRNSKKLAPTKNEDFVEEDPKPESPPDTSVHGGPTSPKKETIFGLPFVTPEEEVILPSRGEYYPKDHYMHGKESVIIKHMTAKEEDILSTMASSTGGSTFERLISSLLVDKKIEVKSLLEEDKMAILLSARITGYGKEYVSLSYCQNCEKETKHTFDLSKVSIIDPEVDVMYNPDRDTFTYTTPISSIDLELSNKVLEIEKEIEKEREKKEKYNIPFNQTVSFLQKVIVSANTVVDVDTINKLIQVLPAAEAKGIKNFYNYCRPQLSTLQESQCQVCGNTSEREAPFTWALFRTDA